MNFDDYLEELRFVLKNADYALNENVFEKAKQLFLFCENNAEEMEKLKKRVSDFEKAEFFLNVDNNGLATYPAESLLQEFRSIQAQKENFKRWFQEEEFNNEKPVLLIARWLSHFAGFRHRCAHVFLDHPILEDYTFVQLRSFGKADSPGFLDIPVGGHAKGIATVKETAKEELEEELNLDIQEDIIGFTLLDKYSYYEPPDHPDSHNIEHRTVFCGSLKNEAVTKIKFLDGEVAAICIFSISELKILLKEFPERVASGLARSFAVYNEYKHL